MGTGGESARHALLRAVLKGLLAGGVDGGTSKMAGQVLGAVGREGKHGFPRNYGT